MSGASGQAQAILGQPKQKQAQKKKSTFFGLRSLSDDGEEKEKKRRLAKKGSAVW
jgi:hypothetical protein